MVTLEIENTCLDAIPTARLARALWESMDCSVEELAVRSSFPASPKTLWRLIQGTELWNRRYAEPLVSLAAERLHIPTESLWRCIHSDSPCLDQTTLEFLFSRYWHLDPRALGQLDRYMQQHEDAGRRWFHVGVVPSLCFFPERPLRRFVRHHFRSAGRSNAAATEAWTAFGLSWRERIMNSSIRPDRVLMTFRSAFDAIRDRRFPFDRLDAEDKADLVYSLAYDAVWERGLRLAFLDEVANSLPQSLRVHFEEVGSVLVMSDDLVLRGMTSEPLIRTIARDCGPEQAQLMGRQLSDVDQLLDIIGGPMDKASSFALLLSLLD